MSVWYDEAMIKSLKDLGMFWWRQRYNYKSNWRILHIDNMEGFIFNFHRGLPVSRGGQIQFFHYAEMA